MSVQKDKEIGVTMVPVIGPALGSVFIHTPPVPTFFSLRVTVWQP